jgi:hypothetical protein
MSNLSETKVAVSIDSIENRISIYLQELYNVSKVTEEELKLWWDTYSYKGFDRSKVLKDLMDKVPDPKIAQQIILVCGLLGPQRASLIKLINGRSVASYGIPASGQKGTEGISCQRVMSATADLCAYFLKKVNMPRRLNVPCPAWLQFPSAGSIQMPNDLRQLHIDFARRFSTVIGGEFNEQIYEQMVVNAYLNSDLHLFDDVQIKPLSSNSPISVPASSFNPNKGDVGIIKTTQSDRQKR